MAVALYLDRWNVVGDHVCAVVLLLITVAASLSLAAASYYLVEQPFVRLKDHRFGNRAGQAQLLVPAPASAGSPART